MTLRDAEAFDLRVLRRAERYQRWVLDAFGDALSGRVLEVGAGNGNFTRWIAPRVTRVVALEPEPALCDALRGLGLANVEVVPERLEDFPPAERGFDTAVLINVLEHLADDRAAVLAAGRLVRPGGHVCVLVPAHPFLYGSLDRRYAHERRYTRRQVAHLLADPALTVRTLRYFNPLGALGWLVAGRLVRRDRIDPSAVALSERLIVPVGRWTERAGLPVPFGQSVVAVARVAG